VSDSGAVVEETGVAAPSEGAAEATPGVAAIARPTPSAAANDPMRPTYPACFTVVPFDMPTPGVGITIGLRDRQSRALVAAGGPVGRAPF
jgi:hypothetical protein